MYCRLTNSARTRRSNGSSSELFFLYVAGLTSYETHARVIHTWYKTTRYHVRIAAYTEFEIENLQMRRCRHEAWYINAGKRLFKLYSTLATAVCCSPPRALIISYDRT